MSDYTPVVIGSKTRAGGAKPRELATTGEVDRKVGAGNKASVDPDHRKIAALDRESLRRIFISLGTLVPACLPPGLAGSHRSGAGAAATLSPPLELAGRLARSSVQSWY